MDTLELLSESEHPQISVEELAACETVVQNDETIQRLAKDVGQYSQTRERRTVLNSVL